METCKIGGDMIGSMPIGNKSRSFEIYMDNQGIYGTQAYPGYFHDNAGNWYRVTAKDLYILPE